MLKVGKSRDKVAKLGVYMIPGDCKKELSNLAIVLSMLSELGTTNQSIPLG